MRFRAGFSTRSKVWLIRGCYVTGARTLAGQDLANRDECEISRFEVSLKTRVQRLEKLVKRSAPVETDADRWLAKHHPETMERYSQLFQEHRGDTDAVLRELCDDDLDKLIDALDPARRAERARWNGVIGRIRPLVSETDFSTIAAHLRHQFQMDFTSWRWPVVTFSWLAVCPSPLRGPSIAALKGNQACGPYPWLEVWLRNLVGINSRLPPTISSECIGELVQIRIVHAAGTDQKTWCDVRMCDECGLLRPISIKSCPHCAATSCSWNGERFAPGLGWRGLAESELASFDWGTVSAPNTSSTCGQRRCNNASDSSRSVK
jgi:hypothetical protein